MVPLVGNCLRLPREGSILYKNNVLKVEVNGLVVREFRSIRRLIFWTGFRGVRVFYRSTNEFIFGSGQLKIINNCAYYYTFDIPPEVCDIIRRPKINVYRTKLRKKGFKELAPIRASKRRGHETHSCMQSNVRAKTKATDRIYYCYVQQSINRNLFLDITVVARKLLHALFSLYALDSTLKTSY